MFSLAKLYPLKILSFKKQGLYCEPGKFFIDPWQVTDKAVITHAHADHARGGMGQYLCHNVSAPLLRARLSADIKVQGIHYNESVSINGVKLSFHPAGHILGSAQVRLEYKGYVVVISGDYKTEDDGITPPFEPLKCNEFITESTFGLPIYRWKPQSAISNEILSWIQHNQSHGKTSVLTGYSLGKAQRLMKLLEGTGKLYVHSSIARINEALQGSGIRLPGYSVYEHGMNTKELSGQIIIIPPAALSAEFIKKIPGVALGVCSGWMQIRGNRRWQAADAGFAISDHADWDGLLWAVKQSGAEKIMVTHGQTEVFARYLNENGYNASAIKTRFDEEEGD